MNHEPEDLPSADHATDVEVVIQQMKVIGHQVSWLCEQVHEAKQVLD